MTPICTHSGSCALQDRDTTLRCSQPDRQCERKQPDPREAKIARLVRAARVLMSPEQLRVDTWRQINEMDEALKEWEGEYENEPG